MIAHNFPSCFYEYVLYTWQYCTMYKLMYMPITGTYEGGSWKYWKPLKSSVTFVEIKYYLCKIASDIIRGVSALNLAGFKAKITLWRFITSK